MIWCHYQYTWRWVRKKYIVVRLKQPILANTDNNWITIPCSVRCQHYHCCVVARHNHASTTTNCDCCRRKKTCSTNCNTITTQRSTVVGYCGIRIDKRNFITKRITQRSLTPDNEEHLIVVPKSSWETHCNFSMSPRNNGQARS